MVDNCLRARVSRSHFVSRGWLLKPCVARSRSCVRMRGRISARDESRHPRQHYLWVTVVRLQQ